MPFLGRLHNFSQHPAHVLGMHKKYQRAMRANTRLAKNALAQPLKFRLCGVNIRHFKTDMMLPAERVLGKEAVDRGIGPPKGSISSICVPAVPSAPGVSTKHTFTP